MFGNWYFMVCDWYKCFNCKQLFKDERLIKYKGKLCVECYIATKYREELINEYKK